MRIIIAGSRTFKDYEMLKRITLDILKKLQYTYVVGRKDIEIVSGTAAGADKLGEQFGKEFGLRVVPFPAKWDDLTADKVFIKYRGEVPYNVLAGENRNIEMAEYAEKDNGVLIAFSMGTDGTANMIKHAKKHNLEIYVINGHDGKMTKGNI